MSASTVAWALRYIEKYHLALVPATKHRCIRDGTKKVATLWTLERHSNDGASYLTMG